PTAPAHAASWVLRFIRPILSSAAVVEPPLKPNQPNQRIKPPSATSVRLWPRISRGRPLLSKRPSRGPTTSTPASAHQAPTECTTVEPAKSIKPIFASQPSLFHTQLPNTG